MVTHPIHNPNDDFESLEDGHDHVSEAERLITRLIDHEASAEDREAFEMLAGAEPSLWRLLARRLEDTALLHGAVDDATGHAAATELNDLLARHASRHSAHAGTPVIETMHPQSGNGLRWALSMVGWAAVLVMGLVWWVDGQTSDPGFNQSQPVPVANRAEDHYQQYLESPFVIDEFPPMLLEVDELDDGRVVIEFVRRIEEVLMFESIDDLPGSMESFSPAVIRRAVQSLAKNDVEGVAEDHFEQYLRAPYVMGEYQPTLLEVNELDDGRFVLRFVRRVGEVAVFNSANDLPVTADGELQFVPSEFRRMQQPQPIS